MYNSNATEHTGGHRFLPGDVLGILALLLLTLAVYFQVAGFDFINFDDDLYVVNNPHVQKGLNGESIAWAFHFTRKGEGSYWHPLTWVSHILDCHFFGLDPSGHHLTSLGIHLLNVLLLYAFLRWATGARRRSLFVAALFALHPVNVDSVAWIAERKNLLSTVFWYSSILCYCWYAFRKSVAAYASLLICFVLGLLAKPMLVTLPCALLLLDVWPLRRFQLEADGRFLKIIDFMGVNKRLFLEKLPLFALSFVWVGLSIQSNRNLGITIFKEYVPMDLRVANAVVSYIKYLWKLLWPFNLSIIYPYPMEMLPLWEIAGALLLLAVFTVFAVSKLRSRPWLAVGWFWFLGTLVPVLGLVQTGLWPEMADRWLYMPAAGIFWIAAWEANHMLENRMRVKGLLHAGAVTVILLFTVATYVQLGNWRDSEHIFAHALENTENNAVAHLNYGTALIAKGRYREAIYHLEKAVEMIPGLAEAHYNLANLQIAEKKPEEAIQHLLKVIELKPNFYKAHVKYAGLLARQGHLEGAAQAYLAALDALRFDKTVDTIRLSGEIHNNLANVLAADKKISQARAHYREALRILPRFYKAHLNYASLLAHEGEFEAAASQYRKAIDINGNDYSAYLGLARCLQALDRPDAAIAQYREVLKHNKDYLPALTALTVLNANRGDYGNAVLHAREIVRLEPENSVAYYNLACMLSRDGRLQEAAEALLTAVEKGYDKWALIRADKDLESLRASDFFKPVADRIDGKS